MFNRDINLIEIDFMIKLWW